MGYRFPSHLRLSDYNASAGLVESANIFVQLRQSSRQDKALPRFCSKLIDISQFFQSSFVRCLFKWKQSCILVFDPSPQFFRDKVNRRLF